MKREENLLRVLIVDDLKSMRDEFAAICHEFVPDAHIDEAADVWEAIGLLTRKIPTYDVIFTDINMPNVSGHRLISHARSLPTYRDTPIIVISVMSGRNDIEKALQLGANGYLMRPLQKDDFEVIQVTYLNPIMGKKERSPAADL